MVKFEVEEEIITQGGNLLPGLRVKVDHQVIGLIFMSPDDAVVVKAHLDRIAKLEEMLDWARQTVHRAYHYTTETPMDSCQKDICVSIRRFLGMEG